MHNNSHSNPFISVLSGTLFGITAFVDQHGFLIENGIELLKVICFGLIGGIFGYVGKLIALFIHNKIKRK